SGRVCRRGRSQGSLDRLWRRSWLRRAQGPAWWQRLGRRRGQRARCGSPRVKPWLSIVGIGENGIAGLNAAARTLVDTAEILVGGERHLAMVPSGGGERLTWQRPFSDTIGPIAPGRAGGAAVVALRRSSRRRF